MALKNWNLGVLAAANTDYDLVVATAAKETILLSTVVTNYSNTGATVIIKHTDASNNLMGYLYNKTVDTGETIVLDFKVIPEAGEKIRVQASQTNVSFLAYGDES